MNYHFLDATSSPKFGLLHRTIAVTASNLSKQLFERSKRYSAITKIWTFEMDDALTGLFGLMIGQDDLAGYVAGRLLHDG
jgi:hypothetical protein